MNLQRPVEFAIMKIVAWMQGCWCLDKPYLDHHTPEHHVRNDRMGRPG